MLMLQVDRSPFRLIAAPAVLAVTYTVSPFAGPDSLCENDYGGQGRDTLLNTTLKIFGKDGMLVKDQELETPQDLRDALKTHLGICSD